MNQYHRSREKRIAPDDRHHLLEAWPRRALLDELATAGRLDLGALTARLADRADGPRQADRECIRTALYHHHLPKCRDYGVLRERRGRYELTPHGDSLAAQI